MNLENVSCNSCTGTCSLHGRNWVQCLVNLDQRVALTRVACCGITLPLHSGCIRKWSVYPGHVAVKTYRPIIACCIPRQRAGRSRTRADMRVLRCVSECSLITSEGKTDGWGSCVLVMIWESGCCEVVVRAWAGVAQSYRIATVPGCLLHLSWVSGVVDSFAHRTMSGGTGWTVSASSS